jgi:hypothetical protein
VFERVGGTLLVFQCVAPDIILPAGIFLPGTGTHVGRYLTDEDDQQAGYKSEKAVNTHSDCKGIKKMDNTIHFSLFFITFAAF